MRSQFFLDEATQWQELARFYAGVARNEADELADMTRCGWRTSINVERVRAYYLCRSYYEGYAANARSHARMARVAMGLETYGGDE